MGRSRATKSLPYTLFMVFYACKYNRNKLHIRIMKQISLCIPTYKRKVFLEQALSAMISQILSGKLENIYEIVVFNDNGADDTDLYMIEMQKKYRFITYAMQNGRIGLRKAIEHVPTLTSGKYIWFFSDDDLPTEGSLQYVYGYVLRQRPGIMFGNVDDFDGRDVVRQNMLRMSSSIPLSTRKDFFRFLSRKIGCITYFTSYISNFIIRRDLFAATSSINRQYDSSLNMTPLITPLFYTKLECLIVVLKKSIVLRRIGNESWVDPDPVAQVIKSYKISGFHFGTIQKLNIWDIPFSLHLYFIAHAIERTLITWVILLPFGMRVVKLYWNLEKKCYSLIFPNKHV